MDEEKYGIDLHIHTTNSDGTRTLEETIEDAKAFGLTKIAVTDHNQFALIEPKIAGNLEIFPGAEFSTSYLTQAGRLLEVHVVGLFFEGVPEELRKIFRKIPLQRKAYLDAIITRLNHLGMSISYEELCNAFPDSNQLGRRHIAELLVKKNYADDITDAFDRLIGNRSPYWVDSTKYMKYMSLEDCVSLICEHRGFPILAHPYHYHCEEADVLRLVMDFKSYTKDHPAGMEVYYSKYDDMQRKELATLAETYRLFPSAASDRHALSDPFIRGDEQLLENMKNAWKTGSGR